MVKNIMRCTKTRCSCRNKNCQDCYATGLHCGSHPKGCHVICGMLIF